MKLKNLGVWAGTDGLSAADATAFARRVQAWGYGALWISEAVGREVFSACAWLLANTSSLIIASGIANIYARDPFSAAAAQKGLNEQSGGRFLLGLGVSHIPLVEGVRKLQYGKPVATMRAYLRAMAEAPYQSVPPAVPPKTVLAALGPKMLELRPMAPIRTMSPQNTLVRHGRSWVRANCCASSRARFSKRTPPQRVRWHAGFSPCIWACLTMSTTGGVWVSPTRTSRGVDRIGWWTP